MPTKQRGLKRNQTINLSRLALDVGLGISLAEKLQAPLCKADHFALIIVLHFVVRLYLAVRNLPDHIHNVVRLSNQPNKLLVFGFEELEQGPNRNVLESGVAAGEESAQVAVDAIAWLVPVMNEDAVIAHCSFISKLSPETVYRGQLTFR